jgi:uncharacterized protein
MSLLDHLFVLLFAVAYPIAGAIGFRRFMRRVREGISPQRMRLYRNTMISHWSLLAAALAVWAMSGRSWEALGLGLELDFGFLLGVLLTLLGIAILVLQLKSIGAADDHVIERIAGRFGNLEMLLPRSRPELSRFYLLSLTAGVVEEILWRGFLIWYLLQFLPLWLAGLVCTVGFGLAHAYQGGKQLPAVTLVGGGFVILYLVTGSVWLPIVLHAAVDILQGRLAWEVTGRRREAVAARG